MRLWMWWSQESESCETKNLQLCARKQRQNEGGPRDRVSREHMEGCDKRKRMSEQTDWANANGKYKYILRSSNRRSLPIWTDQIKHRAILL